MTAPRIEHLGESVTLYLGDAREIVPTLPAGAVAITDPPYGIAHTSNHGASWQGRTIACEQDTAARDEVLARFDNAAVFGTWKTPPIVGTKGTLVWDKGPAFGMGDLRFPWKGSFELIYVRGSIWAGTRDEGVLRGHIVPSWESAGRVHPHQKPVSLLAALIRKTPPDVAIIDPFLGSGTSGVAAVQLGRAFIGVEIEPGHFDTTCRRIADELRRPRLFAEPRRAPTQEALAI